MTDENTLTGLLQRIDEESALVVSQFKANRIHRSLDDFTEALKAYEQLEQERTDVTHLSIIEASTIAHYYSMLACRLALTSRYIDKNKEHKEWELIGKAKYLTIDDDPIDSAHLRIGIEQDNRLFNLKEGMMYKLTGIFDNILEPLNHFIAQNYFGKLTRLCRNTGGYRETEESNTRLLIGRLAGGSVLEFAGFSASLLSSLYGISNLSNGDYTEALVGFGAALSIPIAHYIYSNIQTRRITGHYSLPKIDS